nr:MAG TPA: hypothetical protein [Caudoviricetes sp.]
MLKRLFVTNLINYCVKSGHLDTNLNITEPRQMAGFFHFRPRLNPSDYPLIKEPVACSYSLCTAPVFIGGERL